MKQKGYNNTVSPNGNALAQKFKTYQGQEMTEELGLNLLEFKWRMHDPAIGRFIQIDPLAEDYVHNSTYAFAENRVIDGNELEGLEWVSSKDNSKLVYDPSANDGKGDYTEHATNNDRNVGNSLTQTKAGTKQFNVLVNSTHPITVELDETSEVTYNAGGVPRTGSTLNNPLEYDKEGNVSALKSEITIFQKAVDKVVELSEVATVPASDVSNTTFNDLNFSEIIGVTLGHEIPHTTSENITMGVNQGRRAAEDAAQKVSDEIINEIKGN